MRIIDTEEQKKILVDMLAYFDEKCRSNGIHYSLIGGSLIGAVRHKGFIPWDDDVDVILDKADFYRIKKILDEERGIYRTLKDGEGGENFGFLKLIDSRTGLIEKSQKRELKNYGVFIDIFCYFSTYTDERKRVRHFRRIKVLKSLITRRKIDFKNKSLKKNISYMIRTSVSVIIGQKRLKRLYYKVLSEANDSDYIVSNWPVYGLKKEVQLRKNISGYTDATFEGIKTMIFQNYDEILRTTFGDYMQLPPESKRIPHHALKIWWRDEDGQD